MVQIQYSLSLIIITKPYGIRGSAFHFFHFSSHDSK
jgi:hypothetical protein